MITASTMYFPIWICFESIAGPSTRRSKAWVDGATIKRDMPGSFRSTRGRGNAWVFSGTRPRGTRGPAEPHPVLLRARGPQKERVVSLCGLSRSLQGVPGRLRTRLLNKLAHTGFQQVMPCHVGHSQIETRFVLQLRLQPNLYTFATTLSNFRHSLTLHSISVRRCGPRLRRDQYSASASPRVQCRVFQASKVFRCG